MPSGIHESYVIQFISTITLTLLCKYCLVTKSCLILCDPMDYMQPVPGSSVHGILQAKYWNGLPCPPPGDLHYAGIKPAFLTSPVLGRQVLCHQCHLESPWVLQFFIKTETIILQKTWTVRLIIDFQAETVEEEGKRELRVPWISRRSKQSILKEINPEYSLGGLMLKLKR